MRWVPSGSMHKLWSRCSSWRLPSRRGVAERRRALFILFFFLKNDAISRIRVAPDYRPDAMISPMSEPGVGCCFFDFLAALARSLRD
ncbi:hypothetical protein Y032_0507g2692 [Ancylostoma ceylanicum]|uniref:Uncharacterized protein n=1 Tax=Ancylostoma ceylanicum TaxID=53326 RepID=A0A016WUT5_9BILA|nr:hypothetical protein Y032_0507g2692 [Ancylostoma ceylanicum]